MKTESNREFQIMNFVNISKHSAFNNQNTARKNKLWLAALVLLTAWSLSGAEAQAQNNVGIGTTTPNPKAVLELQATDKGLLTPRMTQVQMLSIPTPPNGLLVYNTTKNCFYYFDNVTNTWKDMCSIG
ncbi:MAG: hypothetical protein H7331_02335, partial [Bacteroidia bacterium]|nr:hypothetical protein [Bacteroidia bacterium]